MWPEKEAALERSYVVEGVALDIIAENAGADGWRLSIENELGIRSIWLDTFATAQAALDAGMMAIESEGVAAFQDIEGFDYLLES